MSLHPIIFSGAAAFVVATAAIPFARHMAPSMNLLDAPGALKAHERPIPRAGGAAMALGLVAGVLLTAVEMSGRDWLALFVVMAIWAVGFADDLWNLAPSVRLASDLVGGAILWFAGWQTHWFTVPALDLAATCVLFGLLINAMNMLDGADGLAAGVAAIGSIGLILSPSASPSGMTFAACLIAVCAAMLIYNFPPASIFMGDSGSTLIGALIGLMILQRSSIGTGFHDSVPLLIIFLLPIGDVGLAVVRRLRTRNSPFRGDRRHFYDLLLQRGWPLRRVLAVSYGVTAILVSAGMLCEGGRASALALAAALGVALFAFAWFLGSFTPERQAQEPQGATLVPKIEA